MNPASIKVQVATIDRTDKRLMPQMPCPLVHPEPKRVPKPTNSPAMMSKIGFVLTIMISGLKNIPYINGVMIRPDKNQIAGVLNIV